MKSAQAIGASNFRILLYHITPNVLLIAFLYIVYGIAWAIIIEAGLSFLGFGDPTTISWGRALNLAFETGGIRRAWWWVLPPSLGIVLVVVPTFLLSHAFEEIINPKLRRE